MVDVREDRCFAASHAEEFFWVANVLLGATDVVGVRVGWVWTSAFWTLMLRRYGIVSWSMILGLLRLVDTYDLTFHKLRYRVFVDYLGLITCSLVFTCYGLLVYSIRIHKIAPYPCQW